MSLAERTYPVAPRGLATSFEESELPITYAFRFRNRFINAAGGAEKRQGITQLGSTISGTPTIDALHELVKSDGTTILFASGQGKIWKYDNPGWSQVHSGLSASAKLQSVQMGKKLIFCNGSDRNFYTENGTTFQNLEAVIERGDATSGTDRASLHDSDVTNWVTDTQVANNDLVRNISKNAYGIITAVVTGSVAHTNIGPTGDGLGNATATAASGDQYEIIDLVELNAVPTSGQASDNVATLNTASSATGIYVSAVADWTQTEVRVGDYIHNTTRAAVTQVTAIATAHLRCVGVSGQTNGDSIALFKSAMPISERMHVHFGRLYHIDERDRRLVRISGANNPEDMTTDAATLDSTTFKFGELQPTGDAVQSMASFQRFFTISGRKNTFLFSGTNPVADTSADSTDFSIVGLFPQGIVSPDGLVSIGNDAVIVTPDGVQTIALAGDASTLARSNISEPIRVTIRTELANTGADDIVAFHYPRRSWFCLKIGSLMYVFNYTPIFGQDQLQKGDLSPQIGSWSLFDGKFARQKAYFVRNDGTMICAGTGGKVYQFDQGDYADDGEVFTTEVQTAWLTMDEPRKSRKTKQFHYLRPIFNTGATITYTVRGEAGFEGESTDTITISASGGAQPIGLATIGQSTIGGSSVQNPKFPMRLRGREARFTITTTDSMGPDVIARFTLEATIHGRR